LKSRAMCLRTRCGERGGRSGRHPSPALISQSEVNESPFSNAIVSSHIILTGCIGKSFFSVKENLCGGTMQISARRDAADGCGRDCFTFTARLRVGRMRGRLRRSRPAASLAFADPVRQLMLFWRLHHFARPARSSFPTIRRLSTTIPAADRRPDWAFDQARRPARRPTPDRRNAGPHGRPPAGHCGLWLRSCQSLRRQVVGFSDLPYRARPSLRPAIRLYAEPARLPIGNTQTQLAGARSPMAPPRRQVATTFLFVRHRGGLFAMLVNVTIGHRRVPARSLIRRSRRHPAKAITLVFLRVRADQLRSARMACSRLSASIRSHTVVYACSTRWGSASQPTDRSQLFDTPCQPSRCMPVGSNGLAIDDNRLWSRRPALLRRAAGVVSVGSGGSLRPRPPAVFNSFRHTVCRRLP
jgi:hypothetical protein